MLICAVIFSCKPESSRKPALSDIWHTISGDGSPIIVIHGGPGLGSSYLRGHLSDLKDHHTVIYYDQRNSGQSPLTQDTSMIRMHPFLQDIDDLRHYYGFEKVSVLAHSWGGLLGMQYALEFPDRVSKLILMNSSAPSSDLNEQANTKLANRFSADDLDARTRIMRTEAFKNQNPKAIEELMMIGFGYQFSDRNQLKNLNLDLPEDFGLKSQSLGNLYKDVGIYDYTLKIHKISAPTLLLYGLEDPLASFAINSLKENIPTALIKVIEDAGHFPFIEKKDETIRVILDFLKDSE